MLKGTSLKVLYNEAHVFGIKKTTRCPTMTAGSATQGVLAMAGVEWFRRGSDAQKEGSLVAPLMRALSSDISLDTAREEANNRRLGARADSPPCIRRCQIRCSSGLTR